MSDEKPESMIGRMIDGVIRFCLENKLIVFLLLVAIIGAGIMVMPFDYDPGWLPRHPVPVDAIPDIGENQQIVFTKWPGRSPQDVEDQVTYPLTVSLLGVPGVKSFMTPLPRRTSMSASGMMPPPKTPMSEASFSPRRSTMAGKRVRWAPDMMEIPMASTSSRAISRVSI